MRFNRKNPDHWFSGVRFKLLAGPTASSCESGSKLHALPRMLSGLARGSSVHEPRQAHGVRPACWRFSCERKPLVGTWFTVIIFATAMAWVESSVVYYLRTMVDRIEPYQSNPLPIATGFAKAELPREAATLIMLVMVGILAGRNWRSRLGYAAVAFGVWDIFYYVFLKVLCGWPHSLFDWDVLFLLPMPWWGPVLAPVSIALLMILWGTLASGWKASPERKVWLLSPIGMALALYVFMADNLRVV